MLEFLKLISVLRSDNKGITRALNDILSFLVGSSLFHLLLHIVVLRTSPVFIVDKRKTVRGVGQQVGQLLFEFSQILV